LCFSELDMAAESNLRHRCLYVVDARLKCIQFCMCNTIPNRIGSMRRWGFVFALGLAASVHVLSGDVRGSGLMQVRWNSEASQLSASIERVPLSRVLGRVVRLTGWKVLIEPGSDRLVSVVLTNQPTGVWLPRVLGDFSFAFVPGSTAGGRTLRIYRTQAEAATDAIAPLEEEEYQVRPGPIPNELIVRFKPGAKLTPEELAKRLGAKLVGRLDDLNTYRLRFETAAGATAAREQLRGISEIAGVESNVRLPIPEAGAAGAGNGASISLRARVGSEKDQVVVALIDTAVQPLGNSLESFLLSRVSVADGTPVNDGSPTHGTVMSQNILQGVSQIEASGDGTKVRILPVDVYGSEPATTTWNVIRGLEAAAAKGATVFNLSLGGTEDSPLLDSVIASIRAQGGLVLAATGNSPGTFLTYPAASPGALGVTAVDASGIPADYANTGPQARLAGPGSTLIQYGGQTWLTKGTSGATAWVSGLAAGWMSKTGSGSIQAGQWLQVAVPFKPPGSP